MSTTVRATRLLGVCLAALVLLAAVPGIADARFSAARAPALQVSTASMVTPTQLAGTYRCTNALVALTESIEVKVAGFADAGQPAGTTYTYTLSRAGTVVATATSAAKTETLSHSRGLDFVGTTWTLTVEAELGGWTSPAVATRAIGCPGLLNSSGNL